MQETRSTVALSYIHLSNKYKADNLNKYYRFKEIPLGFSLWVISSRAYSITGARYKDKKMSRVHILFFYRVDIGIDKIE